MLVVTPEVSSDENVALPLLGTTAARYAKPLFYCAATDNHSTIPSAMVLSSSPSTEADLGRQSLRFACQQLFLFRCPIRLFLAPGDILAEKVPNCRFGNQSPRKS